MIGQAIKSSCIMHCENSILNLKNTFIISNMNVCFVIPNFNFFISHRADLVKELATQFNIHVITDVSNATDDQIKEFADQSIQIHNLKARNGSMSIKGYFKYIYNLRKIINSIKLDYVFYTTIEISFFGALLKRFINIKKSFFLITGVGSTFYSSKPRYRIIRMIQKITFKVCALNNDHLFIFQNNDDLKLLIKLGFVKNENCLIIPGNGINMNQFSFFKRDYSQEPIFFFASKLLISKGVEEYLKAAKKIIKKNLNAKFLIAGKYDPTQHDPISANSYKKLLEDKEITYLGELSYEEMNEAFRKSTIFVLPSYGEGIPKVLLEAAATGLPLITTDAPGCRDCIKNEINGKLISPRNTNELTDAMESIILTNESKMLEYSRNSELIVHSRYSLDAITKKYINLIN